MKVFLSALPILIASIATAQSGLDTLWSVAPGQGHISEAIYETLLLDDGSVILAGGIFDQDSLHIINGAYKLSPEGTTQWASGFRGLGLGWFRAVTEGNDGSLVFAGFTRIPSEPGVTRNFIVKVDANGDSVWTSLVGGAFTGDEIEAIYPAAGGGYWLFGQSIVAGQDQFHALKISETGDSLDSRAYGRQWSDYLWEAMALQDGGFLLVGDYWDPTAGHQQAQVMKLNANGDSLWGRTYGSAELDEIFFNVVADPTGGYMLGGSIAHRDSTNGDVLIMKISSDGDSLWSRTWGGVGDDRAYSIVQVHNGYALLCNTTSFGAGDADAWILRTGANGDTLFSQTFGNSRWQFLWDMKQVSDLGYILVGVQNISGAGNDGWVLKTTPDPTNVPPDPFELAEPDDGAVIDLFDTVPLICRWNASRDPNLDDVTYLFRAELNGGSAFLENPEGSVADTFFDLNINVPLARLDESSFIDWIVHATDGIDTVATSSGTWQFRIDYTSDAESPVELPRGVSLLAYPNPFNPVTQIHFDLPEKGHVELGVYDITGRLVQTQASDFFAAGSHLFEFSGGALPSGTYFARLSHQSETRITKLVLLK